MFKHKHIFKKNRLGIARNIQYRCVCVCVLPSPFLLFDLLTISLTQNCFAVYIYVRAYIHLGAGRSSEVRSWCGGSSDRSFMGWTHIAISRSSQCFTTGVTKAVVCVILSVGWCI